ncbi:hypothetical protein [Pseudomonas syringae group sp. 247E2]|uniref:hypothetical protein n=1 Tax=Pseudomonas syringae group sp. 247E2 TaxID=3079592 RepID=UPI002911DA82|nr:hypothetical protein [Pseudomonas syringae group sp. 247E2]MDU8608744.1 hypothetical protein [Pseudomonas syringae group sp. 247E2]
MRNSTVENINKRFSWLKSIWDGHLTLTQYQLEKLVDMKTFCTLEVHDNFEKISYNSIKSFCLTQTCADSSYEAENLWEHLLSLRSKIYSTYKPPESEAVEKGPTAEMKINEAYNQAQLATYAYLDIFRFFKNLVESDTTLNSSTKLQIANFLFESNLRFEGIGTNTRLSSKSLSVIQGGKGNA